MGSGVSSRRASGPLRGMSAFLLRAVEAAGLPAVLDTGGVEGAADDLVADAGEVFDTATTDENDRVLLEVVPLTRDVGRDLDAAGEAHTCDFAQGGVRLLRGVGVDAGADPASLRRTLEGGRLARRGLALPALADQLLNSGHVEPLANSNDGAALVMGIRQRADGPC